MKQLLHERDLVGMMWTKSNVVRRGYELKIFMSLVVHDLL